MIKLKTMQVIQPNGTTTICQDSSHKQPLDIVGASGALVGTTMVSCGGSYPRTSACYSFSNDNQWRNLTKMSTPRYPSSAISVSDGIWVTGVVEIPMTKSQIHQNFIVLKGSREDGPALPKPRCGQCVVEYGGVVVLMVVHHDKNMVM